VHFTIKALEWASPTIYSWYIAFPASYFWPWEKRPNSIFVVL
jgi:hypothetical protein